MHLAINTADTSSGKHFLPRCGETGQLSSPARSTSPIDCARPLSSQSASHVVIGQHSSQVGPSHPSEVGKSASERSRNIQGPFESLQLTSLSSAAILFLPETYMQFTLYLCSREAQLEPASHLRQACPASSLSLLGALLTAKLCALCILQIFLFRYGNRLWTKRTCPNNLSMAIRECCHVICGSMHR